MCPPNTVYAAKDIEMSEVHDSLRLEVVVTYRKL